MHRIVTEGHFVCVVTFLPFHVAFLEKEVLAPGMRLPLHGGSAVVIAADAILRVIILVAVVGRKILVTVNRVPRENKRAGNAKCK